MCYFSECQTRDSIASHRDSGLNGTPPPPPPPMRRPPVLQPSRPPVSPSFSVPTPPPPPGYFDRRAHDEIYGPSMYNHQKPPPLRPHSGHYEVDDSNSDPYNAKKRSETSIQISDKSSRYGSSRSEKSTPDVLVTH